MSKLGMVQVLFAALALVMAGLGLSLELADFRRILSERRAVIVALALQMLVLPMTAFLLAVILNLPPPYAVGLMLLAAAPGSVSSSLYSQVFGGNVALSVSLTGINTVLSMITLPLICGWSIAYFSAGNSTMPPVIGKLAESMATLIIPVIIGMTVRARIPRLADRLDKPMRLISLLVLIAFSAAAIVTQWAVLSQAFTELGLSVVFFNLLSLVVGYRGSQLSKLEQPTSVAIAFQVGVRSAVLSIYVAMTALNDTQIALPAAVYSISMVLLGLSFGFWLRRSARNRVPAVALMKA